MRDDEVIRSLNQYDSDIFGRLRRMLIDTPEETSKLIRAFFVSEKLRDDMAIAIELMRLLVDHHGREHVEKWVTDEWPRMPTIERRRVMAAFFYPELLSTRVAERLFHCSSSGVADRHRILAALARSATERQCEQLVIQLLKQVGEYEDAGLQANFEAFARSVLASLSG